MKKEKMQRRRPRDPLHNLELGNQGNYSASYPMRKLTRMKVVKYLILILVAILVHTTYRMLWKTKDGVNEKVVDKEIETFKNDPKNSAEKSIQEDTQKEASDMEKLAKKRERYEQFKKLMEKEKSEMRELEKTDDKASERRENDKIGDNVLRKNKKLEEKASDIVSEKQGQDNSKENLQQRDNPKQNVLEELQPIDTQQEIENIVKETKLEHQIAEALDKIKSKNTEEVERKVEDIVAEKTKEEKELLEKENLERDFLEKANKLIGEMSSVNDNYHKDQPHGIPQIVTAGMSKHYESVRRLIYSVQRVFPKQKIYVFDLDLTDTQRRHLMAGCNVRVREFWSNLFPSFVSDWDKNHWKPLVIQTALAEFGHIIWINPGHVLSSMDLVKHITTDGDFSIKLYGQKMEHTTFAVTDPTMFKYLQTNMKKIKHYPHTEVYAMVLHNTQELKENFMKYFLACALEKDCMNPPTAKQQDCNFDFSGMKYAECHKYDESAINILLDNWFNFDITSIMRNPASFKKYHPTYDDFDIKLCRDENDMIARRVQRTK